MFSLFFLFVALAVDGKPYLPPPQAPQRLQQNIHNGFPMDNSIPIPKQRYNSPQTQEFPNYSQPSNIHPPKPQYQQKPYEQDSNAEIPYDYSNNSTDDDYYDDYYDDYCDDFYDEEYCDDYYEYYDTKPINPKVLNGTPQTQQKGRGFLDTIAIMGVDYGLPALHAFGSVVDKVTGVVGGVTDAVKNVGSKVSDGVSYVGNKVKDTAYSIADTADGFLGGSVGPSANDPVYDFGSDENDENKTANAQGDGSSDLGATLDTSGTTEENMFASMLGNSETASTPGTELEDETLDESETTEADASMSQISDSSSTPGIGLMGETTEGSLLSGSGLGSTMESPPLDGTEASDDGSLETQDSTTIGLGAITAIGLGATTEAGEEEEETEAPV